MWLLALIAATVSYLLGNLNGAVLVSRLFSHDDVRSHGSGNAGLTNFIRSYGIRRALLVVGIDVGKAVLACVISASLLRQQGYWQEGATLGGICVMLGHVFPVFLGFRGGKGILSGWVIAFIVDWRIGLLIGLVFFAIYFATSYVSLGSVLAAVAFVAGFIIFHWDNLPVCLGGVFMGLLSIFMHRENIKRLCRGEERKTSLFGKGSKQ